MLHGNGAVLESGSPYPQLSALSLLSLLCACVYISEMQQQENVGSD